MTPIATGLIILLILIAAYLAYALVGALRSEKATEEQCLDLHAHITALQREIEVLTPHRNDKGLFVAKPRHNSATDPVCREMADG